MKLRFLLILILLSAGFVAAAQEPMVKITGKPGADAPARNWSFIKEYYHEGMLIDSTGLGKVYRMPVDNLHCLVPDATKIAGMPVKKLKMPEPMPNAFTRKRRF